MEAVPASYSFCLRSRFSGNLDQVLSLRSTSLPPLEPYATNSFPLAYLPLNLDFGF